MAHGPPSWDDITEGITDPVLQARWSASATGGASLSEREVFDIVLALDTPERRDRLLSLVCGGDDSKRRRLDALLAACEDPGEWPSWTAILGLCTGHTPDAADAGMVIEKGDHPVSPEYLGRYRIARALGSGTFGLVWLGFDEDLHRPVAVKVRRREGMLQDPEAFLAEARTAAAVSHPNIVPVYDLGRAADGSIYVVSRFIDGPTLRAWLGGRRPTHEETARIVAKVARALDHAHRQGIVHRDVNPSNILLEASTGEPFVADFGIAVSLTRSLADTRIAGTPAYMSPEQANGEAHRLDGRSDVFSLGAVLYEMLTGTRAFLGSTVRDVLQQVVASDPPPPRDREPGVPQQLESICLRAIAKRRRDRYGTAAALAEDVESWIAGRQSSTAAEDLPVEPKGLRSFDSADAAAFLPLLPGLRDRDGLTEGVRFWKRRLDETDPAATFPVGLLYGPTGSGKSSLMKAGIIPRLGAGVQAVVVSASGDDTERRLLELMRREIPDLADVLGVMEAFARARDSLGRKLVVVIDQFEQWLQGHPDPVGSDLVAALRQCDGCRLQAVVLVRDDFAMSAARFMAAVDAPIDAGVRNFATVDLFPTDHARQVLVRFGQGLGRLPAPPALLGTDQAAFVDAAIAGLAADGGLVVPVQLALFVDLVKARPWIPATLAALGDSVGRRRLLDRVGVAFLHESFDARSANPVHRLHAAAARRVLESLLPAAASTIKGHTRSRSELVEAAGRGIAPERFAALLRILDGELRLITPAERPPPCVTAGDAWGIVPEERYQLTHDYLVPALREWVTVQRRKTARGRAELMLADRTAAWSDRPEPQQLPTSWEWFGIRLCTWPSGWTAMQGKMMAVADRRYGARIVATAIVAASVVATGLAVGSRVTRQRLEDRAQGAVRTLLAAGDDRLEATFIDVARPEIAAQSAALLRLAFGGDPDPAMRLRAAVGLARLEAADEDVWQLLAEGLLTADPGEVAAIRVTLAPRAAMLAERWWEIASDPAAGPERLRAAAALAEYARADARWETVAQSVARDLVRVPPMALGDWMSLVRPAAAWLVPEALAVAVDPGRPDIERLLAAEVLGDFASESLEILVELVVAAEPAQLEVVEGRWQERIDDVVAALETEVGKPPPAGEEIPVPALERAAVRRAKAAATLLRMGRPDRVWPLFTHGADPRARGHLLAMLGPFGVDPATLADHLATERDVSAKRALVLGLGGMTADRDGGNDAIPEELVTALREAFMTDSDPGLHGALEWTLSRWGEGHWIAATISRWAEASRAGSRDLHVDPARRAPGWYVNGEGMTLVTIPGPVEFLMGSPSFGETRGGSPARRHRRRINRSFAIATTPVTLGQFEKLTGHGVHSLVLEKQLGFAFTRSPDLPVVDVTWFQAAAYCNALSRAEGVPEEELVYEEDGAGNVTGSKTDHLSLSGYRLPTEAEWEYAARAGATTGRAFGDADGLLVDYAWYQYNSVLQGIEVPWPVAEKKPNDFGLFDHLGNVWNWCQETFATADPAAVGELPVDDGAWGRTMAVDELVGKRGGSFAVSPRFIDCAFRGRARSGSREADTGFRVARTLSEPAATRPSGPLLVRDDLPADDGHP